MNERAIFEAALEIADPIARKAFLDKAFQGDPDARGRIEALLKSHKTTGSLFDIPAIEHMGRDAAGTTANTMIGQSADDVYDSDDEPFDVSFLQPGTKAGSIGTLGHYEILKVLGQGGFGVVFKAFDEKLHRLVAIKVMSAQMAATSPPRKRFLREARSAAAIKHENIVQVHSVEEQPLPYLVMEYIDGETLQQKLVRMGPLDSPEVLYIGRQIASGLAAAHALGLIHRDIKPGNILLEGGVEQKVRITDFGLARAADDASLTRSGMISGTPMYMAPEQALGQNLDQRTDLFSLGSVLYQMACGRPPFRAPTTIAVLRRVAEDTPRPLREIVPEIPDWLALIINRLLAKKPEDRFQTSKEVAELLGKCQTELQQTGRVTCVQSSHPAPRGEPSSAASSTSSRSSPQATPGTSHAAVTASPVIPGLSSRRSVMSTFGRWLLTGIIAALAIAAVFILNNRRNDQTENLASGERQPSDPASKISKPESQISNPALGWHGWPADAPAPAIAPFDAAHAKQHQEEWASYLNVPVEFTNSIGMKFVLIPPGEFTMGSTQSEIEAAITPHHDDSHWQACIQSEGPQHRVILTQPIYLGIHEVTQLEYQSLTQLAPAASIDTSKDDASKLETPNHPQELVSWNEAAGFCNQLNQKDELKSFYVRTGEAVASAPGNGYRLPTEAEWEFACRAGTITKSWLGNTDEDLQRAGWFESNSGGTAHRVGELHGNPLGLFDMHGNVWEWVEDWWEPTTPAPVAAIPSINPVRSSSTVSRRVIRGGGWDYRVSDGRASTRYANAAPFGGYTGLGFRVALTIDAVPELLNRPSKSAVMAQPAADPDRELAEWALSTSNPNVAIVEGEAGSPVVNVLKLADLPVGKFHVIELVLTVDAETFSDADLERMARVSHLKQISLGSVLNDQTYPLVTDRGIEALSQAAFADGLQSLILYPQLPSITDATILSINRFTGLQQLAWDCPSVTDVGIQQIELPALLAYHSWSMPFSAASLLRLTDRSPQITTFGVNGASMSGVELTPLAKWRLRELFLDQSSLTNGDLPVIGTLTSLAVLHLSDNPELSREGISHLQSLTNMEELDLYRAKVDDESLLLIAGFAKLKNLNLNDTLITDLGLETLAGMPALTTLRISGCKGFTEAGIRKLEAALPMCQIVSDFPEAEAR